MVFYFENFGGYRDGGTDTPYNDGNIHTLQLTLNNGEISFILDGADQPSINKFSGTFLANHLIPLCENTIINISPL